MVLKRKIARGLGSFSAAVLILFLAASVEAQTKTVRLSVATGGTGGVYYVFGGGIAQVISKNIPHVEATAEVTAASVDNCKLIQARKAEMALVMADVAYDAFKGTGRFKAAPGAIPVRTLGVLYSNFMHFVTLEGSGVKSLGDLRGKRVSTGAPGSGTEVKALRVLESYGINPEKDLKRERLSVAESAGALKDRKVDAFAWDGGLPTAAVLDLAATPGMKVKLLSNADHLDLLTQTYGPVYFKLIIPKTAYPNMEADVSVAGVANVLICHEKMENDLAYQIVKVLLEKQPDLVAVHKEAMHFTPQSASVGSSIPFHPGAVKYFQEKGMKMK